MEILELFKEYNPDVRPCEPFRIESVQEAVTRSYDWSFLPMSAIDIINRFSMNTVQIVDMLYLYQYIGAQELVDIMTYATGLPFINLDFNFAQNYGKQQMVEERLLVYRNLNGVDNVIFVSIDNLLSEAQLNIEYPGRSNKVFYLIPTNFEIARNPDYLENIQWNYYAMFGRYMQYCLDNRATDLHLDVVHIGKKQVHRALCRIGPDREECNLFKLNERMNSELIRETIKVRSSNQNAVIDLDAGHGVVVTLSDIFKDGKLEVRFTAESVLGGYCCVCRLHEQRNISLTIDQLGFDPAIVKQLKDITERPSGLTVFTGKIRTGKNTTMASVANHIVMKPTLPSLMSVDDPIEIVGAYPQVDYRGDIALLESAIRLAKKLDLDTMTLNEIPNAKVAFGVRDLVNSSIHTLTTWHMNRIWHLPHKLFEYFGESYRDLISQMNLVCNQRLYKKQCTKCQKEIHREDYAPGNEHEDERIYKFFKEHDLYASRVAQGCTECGSLGYEKGKIVVLPEICVFTQDLVMSLFAADRPYEMEVILMKHVLATPFSLEKQMCNALLDGRLSSHDILSIV